MSGGLHVELLGRFRASRSGIAHVRFRTQKTASLLAYLALHPGRRHSRDSLIQLLWPEDNLDAGRHSLNVAIWSLRRLLDEGDPEPILLARRSDVGLNPELVTSDLAAFEAAADTAGDDPAALDAALSAYRGEFLPGHFEDWVQPVRERLAERHLVLVRRRILLAESRGEAAVALESALRAAEYDPLREELHAEILRLYLLNGEPNAAVEHYRCTEALFLRDLGEPLSPTLRLLLPAPSLPGLPRRAHRFVPSQRGGALPVGSPFYVRRAADEELQEGLTGEEGILLVKGSARTGKSSLLLRGIQAARSAGFRAAHLDLEALPTAALESTGGLYLELATRLRDQLEIPITKEVQSDAAEWGPGVFLDRFLRRELLAPELPPLVWTLDGVDRLFSAPAGADLFRQIRSWHNARALCPDGPWGRLRVVIAYASEVHLFIQDLNQSPFNVGRRIQVEEFTAAQVADLNFRRGSPLGSRADVDRLMEVVGGHPHLVQVALEALAAGAVDLEALESEAEQAESYFGTHLRALLGTLRRDPALEQALVRHLHSGDRLAPDAFYRLRSAGLLVGEQPADARPRCRLYSRFFRHQLAGPDTRKVVGRGVP